MNVSHTECINSYVVKPEQRKIFILMSKTTSVLMIINYKELHFLHGILVLGGSREQLFCKVCNVIMLKNIDVNLGLG